MRIDRLAGSRVEYRTFTGDLQRINPGDVHGRQPTPAMSGQLEVKPEQHAALVDGHPLSLTLRELQLLTAFAEHPQRIMTRDELFTEAWGSQPRAGDRSVDVYVSRLRGKLEEALPGIQLIHTHNGIGYRFSPDG